METMGVWFVRAYVDLLDGDVLAALLLSQIAYWYAPARVSGKTKLRVWHNGELWLAKSATDWQAELGFTPKQAYRCIDVLVKKGLIVTRLKKFDGTPTTHIQLTESGYGVLNCQQSDSHLASKESSSSLQGKSLTETTAKTTTENTTEMEPAGEPAKPTGEDKSKNNKEVIEKEIYKKSEDDKGQFVLANLWNERMAEKYPGATKTLTKKEYGQLKQFQSKLGEQASTALEFALKNWTEFGYKAKSQSGLATYPHKPMIGFLLTHYDSLLEVMTESKPPALKFTQGTLHNPPSEAISIPKHDVQQSEKPVQLSKEQALAEIAMLIAAGKATELAKKV